MGWGFRHSHLLRHSNSVFLMTLVSVLAQNYHISVSKLLWGSFWLHQQQRTNAKKQSKPPAPHAVGLHCVALCTANLGMNFWRADSSCTTSLDLSHLVDTASHDAVCPATRDLQ